MSGVADLLERDHRFREEALPHLPSLGRFALSLTREVADAEDLAQETYLRAYRAWDQYEPGTSCRAWLYTICRNVFLRNRERGLRVIVVPDAELEALDAASGPIRSLDVVDGEPGSGPEIGAVVDRALDGLPEQFRSAVVLVDIEDQSYETAAGVLSIPPGTLRSRLFRGRRLLREALRDYAREEGIPVGPVEGEDILHERIS